MHNKETAGSWQNKNHHTCMDTVHVPNLPPLFPATNWLRFWKHSSCKSITEVPLINAAIVLTSPGAIIGFLNVIHLSVCYIKTMFKRLDSVLILRQKPTQLAQIDRASSYLWTPEPTQLRKYKQNTT
jgi:hypothetical protein